MVDNTRQSIWERHAQTIMMFVITGLIAWVGTSVADQKTQIALLQQSVVVLQNQVDNFTKKPRFTKQDFDLEMRSYDLRLLSIERELSITFPDKRQ